MRPRTLDEIVGQEHLLGPSGPLRALIESGRLSSIVLWGPPGTGKTTLARVVATATERVFVPLSAVTAGVKDVRQTADGARRRLAEQGQGTILFLDEVHRFNKAQQDALLPSVEEGTLTLIGATTENPFFELNAPLLSRATLFRLEPLSPPSLMALVERALEHEGASAEAAAMELVVDLAGGDARTALTILEMALALAEAPGPAAAGEPAPAREPAPAEEPAPAGRPTIAVADVERARAGRVLRYGRDEHYDVISAFIKSVRGSDPDAGLYWLARMLAAGEDARFVARRLVILASEDIGMADPMALVVADAAARAVEMVGLPEAGLNLAQAVVHLAAAPKSNRVAMGLWRAEEDVTNRPAGPVPAHLADSHYRSARTIGHGVGYAYPHDDPRGWVPQRYRPDEVAGRVYYEPSSHGAEPEVAERLAARPLAAGPGEDDTL
ncbi:MAG: replication-associated recombination protein A [Acidimicrobiales bacterium]